VSRWQGRWLMGMWLLLPGLVWGEQPLVSPRASRASNLVRENEPLKLARPANRAESRTGAAEPSRPKNSSWITTTASLLFVLTLIAGGAYVLRRQGRRIAGLLPDEVVQVLGRRYLDSRNTLQLVRCGSKILILANSAQQGLRTLSEITDPLEVELITRQCLADSADRPATVIGRLQTDSTPRSTNGPIVAGGPRV
jgi:flagellar biogenesis protein FliO